MKQLFFKNVKALMVISMYYIFHTQMEAQNTNYTPLYNSGNFTKTVNLTLAVGTVAATADATAGAASYSIPIAVPPGTNGVEPSIAVVYNSMSSTGVAGMGWSISGLSMISRVGQTIYHNNTLRPVELSSNDRFALDGMRIMSKSGTYGASGATYGTEAENFATLTSNGSMGGGPQWFSLVTKEGVTMEYGNTVDSRFLNQNNTIVLYWRLNKILYTDGNYIEFKYTNVDRDSRIDEINYTGNVAAGLLPYNKLKFSYTVRSDVKTSYEANASIVSKYLLDKITVTAESSAAFKIYTFNYATNNNINSFLKEVVETGSSGTTLNSTIFKYGDLPTPFQTGSSSAIAGQQVDVFTGDFNADGYSDIMACTRNVVNNIVYHTEFKIYKKDPTASNSTFVYATSEPLPPNYIVFKPKEGANSFVFTSDYTGDGADDVVTVKTTGTGASRVLNEMRIYKSQNDGASFANPTIIPPYTNFSKINTNGNFFFSGDFNGDGVSDMLTMLGYNTSSTYGVHMYLGNISSGFGTVGITGTFNFDISSWATVDRVQILDFNGDDKSDIMLIKDGNCEIFTLDGYVARRLYFSGYPTKWHLLFFGDFNGDGKTDILARTSTTNNNAAWFKSISTGTGFVQTPFIFSHTPDINEFYYGDKLLISDYNGDGKGDISLSWNYWVNQTTLASKTDMHYSKGDDFYAEQYLYSKSFVSSPTVFNFDADGDGRSDIYNRNYYGDPFDVLYYNKLGKDLLLSKVKNGVDHTLEWTYKRMTEAGSFYTRSSLTAQPLNNVQIPLNLVYELKLGDGIGGNTTTQFAYEQAKLHKEGKGFLGLKKVTASNLATGIKTVTENEFNTTYYTAAPYKTSLYLISSGALLHETTLSNQFVEQGLFSKRIWVKVTSTGVSNLFESRYANSNNTYDTNGNVTQNITNNNGEETTTTTSVYGAFGTPIPVKPTSVTVSKTRCCGPPAFTTVTTYGYNTLGQMASRTDFSGQTQSVVTSYTYNNLGNQTSIAIVPTGMTSRTASSVYDSKGRYVITATNALGQISTATYDPKWGKLLSETGPDGLTTSYNYDAFGRLQTTIMPQGWIITEAYNWDIDVVNGTVHYHTTGHSGKPDVKVWYDILDREKKKQVEGFQNQWITINTTYDARGNVAAATAPYKSGETVLTSTNTYDNYNRLANTSNTFGTVTTAYTYDISGYLTTTTTNAAGQVSSKITDACGRTVSATDYGGTLTYTYNSQGNVTQVNRGSTVLILNEYDAYARQTKLTDINAGVTQYAYDALWQMTSEISPLTQTTAFTYDLAGRLTQRVGPEGTTTNEYFPSGSGASTNKLKKTTGFSGNLEEYTFDTYGRVGTKKLTIDGIAYTTTYGYNTYNDVTSIAYPSGFTLNSAYDANGYLNTLKNGNNTVTIFTNTGMNGLDQYTGYSLGNGKSSTNTYYFGIPTRYFTTGTQDLNLNWNYSSGNLTSRNDAIKGKTETFTYDNLNRLLTGTVTGLSALTMTYASNGNINSKTDAGNYSYNISKINAVTSVTNSALNIPFGAQNVAYTPYFQPATVSEGTNLLTYTYGADYQRIKGVLTQNGSTTNTRYYLGDYEKDITGASTKFIHYINAGQGLVAIVVRESSVDTYNYVYTDHLGSILTVTNSSGTVIAEQNFDPWGRKRNTTNWTYAGVQTVPAWLYRGFTGHEHLPQFTLINMNGRLYDPMLGCMLSADNNVQMPDFTQNYNRYSYAFNNPLRFTDPNGEEIVTAILIGMAIAAAVHTAAHLLTHDLTFRDWDWGAFAGSVVAGAVGGAVAPALAAAGIGGFVGGAITGAATGFSANLTTGIIHGDKLGKIVGSAFKGALIGAAIGGVIGGIDASIKGQRFWDGKGKVVTERHLLGGGNTPEENYYYTKERISNYNEVTSDKFSEWSPEIPLGFEGDLTVTGIAYPEQGQTFRITSDGTELFSTADRGVRFNFKVPSSNNEITWGVYGNKTQAQITNVLPSATTELNEVVVTANKFNSYLRITGNHRGWAGFLFWR